MKESRKRKNIFYAIYDKDDNYIIGFDKLKDLERGIGLTTGSLSRLCLRTHGNIERTEEDNICSCSQLIYQYTTAIISFGRYTKPLVNGKIYRFWEEEI